MTVREAMVEQAMVNEISSTRRKATPPSSRGLELEMPRIPLPSTPIQCV